jgi:hypothetical protein
LFIMEVFKYRQEFTSEYSELLNHEACVPTHGLSCFITTPIHPLLSCYFEAYHRCLRFHL